MHPHLLHQIADQDRRSALQRVTPARPRRAWSLRRWWRSATASPRATGASDTRNRADDPRAGACATLDGGERSRRRSPPNTATSPPTCRAFGRLWLSTGSSNLADGILFAGLPVLAVQITDSPALISGVAVALMLPMALAALPSGVVADRYDRRQVLVVANALRVIGITAVLVAIAAGELGLAAIYAVAAIAGGSEMLADTTAQTAVPALVDEDEQLESANARLGGTQVVMNDAVGAPIGSFLAGVGVALAFGVPALLFAVAALLARRLPLSARPRPANDRSPDGPTAAVPSMLADLREGVRYLVDQEILRRLAIANAASNLGNTAFFAVFVVFVVGPLDLPAATYGAFLAAVALGGLLGSLVAGRIIRVLGHSAAIRSAAALAAGCYLVVSLTSDWRVVAGCLAVLGAISIVWNVASRVLRQLIVPDRLLGRATSSMAFLAIISSPLGGLLGGVVAETFGVRSAGMVAVTANLLALVLLRRITKSAVRQARTSPGISPDTTDEVALDEPQLSASPRSG